MLIKLLKRIKVLFKRESIMAQNLQGAGNPGLREVTYGEPRVLPSGTVYKETHPKWCNPRSGE